MLAGHCVELGAEGLPLAPLIDALRTLARTTERAELAEVLGPARRGLGRLLPELDPGGAAEPAADGVQVSQLLELVLGLLGRPVPADQVTRAHAVVLSSLAMSVWRANDMDATMSLAARAVQAAREVGAVQQEADSSITLGSARGYLSADDAGLDDLRAGLALATDIGAHFIALRAYVNISDVLELLGRHQEAAGAAREGMALADRVGLARSLGAFLAGNLAESLLRLGRWTEAEQLATQAVNAMPEGVFAATVLLLRAELAAMTGRYQDADTDVRAARQALGQTRDEQYALTLLYADALVALGRGDLDAARRLTADGLADYGGAMSGRYVWPVLWLASRTEADGATRARDRREEVPDGTAARYQELASLRRGSAGTQRRVAWLPGAGHRGTRARRGRGRRHRVAGGGRVVAGGRRALPAGVHLATAGRGGRGGGRPAGRRP